MGESPCRRVRPLGQPRGQVGTLWQQDDEPAHTAPAAHRAEARTDKFREKLDELLHDQKVADAVAVEALMKSEEQR
jgi:hypothetical protein